jgi:uncharacterized DUF497 family protein
MDLEFEWDADKERANRRKHGVGFAEALTVFGDPLAGIRPDPRHSGREERFVILGRSDHNRLLAVMFTEPAGNRIRRYSARTATPRERRTYEEDYR